MIERSGSVRPSLLILTILLSSLLLSPPALAGFWSAMPISSGARLGPLLLTPTHLCARVPAPA